MTTPPISLLTICGLEELDYHSARGVSHVLSILDPGWPELEAFWAYDMVIPIGPAEEQQLTLVHKDPSGTVSEKAILPVRFTQLEVA